MGIQNNVFLYLMDSFTEIKMKKKKGRGMSKGSSFEREICKKLSLWWSGGKRDDIFWRTSGSGARAKTRSKSGKNTFGQYGDIQATDPIGQPFLDKVSIEVKRGYSESTLSDFLERKETAKKCQYIEFIEQAIMDSQIKDDGKEWILIVKRDRREPILFTSYSFYRLSYVKSYRNPNNKKRITLPNNHITLKCDIKKQNKKILIMKLDDFFKGFPSKVFQ